MIIVTGGAGFIGSNLVQALNRRGERDILVVDNLSNAEKVRNIADLKIRDYMDKDEFFRFMESGQGLGPVRAVFHQGACSDTMASDGRYVLHNNFTWSKHLYHFCEHNAAPFIYASSASVYGDGERFVEDPDNEAALNAYAWSKLLFDDYMRALGGIRIQYAGLRYFNVYGPRESHKGRMASVAWHFRNQYAESGTVRLFEGSGGYANGEQQRDFVYVEDVVAVNLFLLDNPGVSGIFNVGTGRCQSFNDVALAVINNLRQAAGHGETSLEAAVASGEISYIPMPENLVGKYQSYTCASLDKLNAAGYTQPFRTVEEGVAAYLGHLNSMTGKA